ncbi:hypothetical protein BBJ29_008845 [Phytophthora kernoviae]|uniref:Uncharacterized protein n=1 Tax=Phytophthora kernoviae TaxID=325452 RepID=A0A3F2RD03_9STRA|nr:hypothetical protein BBP00_00009306 [Phytophthora kernoviae]RLN65193.1 hypothetical protein BBJ29_008845 [Phytophthora kernoviae]
MQVARKITNVFRIPSKRARRKAISQVTDGADRLRAQANAIVEEISLARTAKKLKLHMSQRMIRVGWVVVLFFHVFNSVYSGMLAYLYYFMAKPKMAYYVQLLRMMPQQNYDVVIALYACIGAVNFYSALKMLIYSLHYRRLVFRKAINPEAENDRANEKALTGFRALKRFVSGFGRAISARGEWFDIVLVMREIVEITSQTVQAHSCSVLISSVWMNQVFCGLIFSNAMANTLVHHNIREKIGLRRLYSTAIDLALDFAWGFIIPCRIIFVYVTMYIKNKHNFPESFSYSDTMQIKAILECNQFFMVSWLDAATTTLPYLNMLSELVITEDIRGFNNLMRLELYNSTVVNWPSSASLSLSYVPSLVTLFIIRSQLVGGIPEGLTTNLSPNIVDIEFVASDFDGQLPDDLADKWSSVEMLYIEHSGLREFPSVVSNMALTDLSLIDNNISVIPEDVQLSDSLMYVMLDRNPLKRIPDSFQSLEDLFFLTFQHTNVTSLPQWLHDAQTKALKLQL